MTREDAVRIWLIFGSRRIEAMERRRLPEHIVTEAMQLNAEDCIDGLIALRLLKIDAPSPSHPSDEREASK